MTRVLALLVVASVGLAQDTEPAAPADAAPDHGALLTDAVLHFRAQRDIVVNISIKHEKAGKDGPAGVAGVVVIAGPGGVVTQPFDGLVETWRDDDGVTVIASVEEVPGFLIYSSDERTVKQVTYEDRRPGLKQLETELASMLEVDRFVKYVMAARTSGQLKATVHDSGDVTFTGPIAREIVRPVSNAIEVHGFVLGNFGHQSRVLRAEATFSVTKDGKFRSVAIKLVRTDPMANVFKGGRIVFRGGVVELKKQKKKNEKHDVEGGSTTYTLTFGDNKPSERSRQFKRKIMRALGAK